MAITVKSSGGINIKPELLTQSTLLDELNAEIDAKVSESPIADYGDATPEQVLLGVAFTSNSGILQTGTYDAEAVIDAAVNQRLEEIMSAEY